MAATLEQSFGTTATLIEGSHGIFDVRLDGELIYSKDETGRFPDNDEVILLVKDRQP